MPPFTANGRRVTLLIKEIGPCVESQCRRCAPASNSSLCSAVSKGSGWKTVGYRSRSDTVKGKTSLKFESCFCKSLVRVEFSSQTMFPASVELSGDERLLAVSKRSYSNLFRVFSQQCLLDYPVQCISTTPEISRSSDLVLVHVIMEFVRLQEKGDAATVTRFSATLPRGRRDFWNYSLERIEGSSLQKFTRENRAAERNRRYTRAVLRVCRVRGSENVRSRCTIAQRVRNVKSRFYGYCPPVWTFFPPFPGLLRLPFLSFFRNVDRAGVRVAHTVARRPWPRNY